MERTFLEGVGMKRKSEPDAQPLVPVQYDIQYSTVLMYWNPKCTGNCTGKGLKKSQPLVPSFWYVRLREVRNVGNVNVNVEEMTRAPV